MPASFNPAAVIADRYRISHLLGRGGMGTVYAATDLVTFRPLAIKVMREISDRYTARFDREAEAIARVHSPHVVSMVARGRLPDGTRYLVLERLEGETLAARLRRVGKLSPEAIGRIGVELLDGVASVHDAGILHRDLSPSNVFLARAPSGCEIVKLLDFGVCRFVTSRRPQLTQNDELLGTPRYIAPELLEHGPLGVDIRADLYSVGVMLYAAVAGRPPFAGPNLLDLLAQICERTAVPLGECATDVDPGFAAIVERAMQRDPRARFQSARELRTALAWWLGGLRCARAAARDTIPDSDTEPTEQWTRGPAVAGGR
jgi:serine/threonine-protein kinase